MCNGMLELAILVCKRRIKVGGYGRNCVRKLRLTEDVLICAAQT
jgi:hypothetical protein